MKILIVSYYFPPLNSIGSLRPYSWAKYWSKMGHEVTVLTTTKTTLTYNLKSAMSGFKLIEMNSTLFNYLNKMFTSVQKAKRTIDSNSITNNGPRRGLISLIKQGIVSFLMSLRQKTGIFSTVRMPDLTDVYLVSFACSLHKLENYDVCISTSGPYVTHVIGYILKRSNRTRYHIVDYRDLWTQNHDFKGLFPFSFIEEFVEKRINCEADLITTVSNPVQNTLKNKYRRENVVTIENGFDPEDYIGNEQSILPEFWSKDNIIILYTGTIYPRFRDPSPLFSAIKRIMNSKNSKLLQTFEIDFIGGCGNIDVLINRFGVSDYVKYRGYYPREVVLEMQKSADVLLFLESSDGKRKGVVTGKLYEYLFSGSPIWGIGMGNDSDTGQLITESGRGKCFEKNTDDIERELISLLSDKNEYKRSILRDLPNGYLEKYTRENLAAKLLDAFQSTLQNRKLS